METNLRPLTLGEILDRTAQLYRTNFLLFAGIFSIYAGVSLVLGLAALGVTNWSKGTHWAVWAVIAIGGFKLIAIFLLLGAAIAAISRAVASVHLGEPVTIRGAYASTAPKLGRYLWLMTVAGALAWLPFALLYGGFLGAVMYFSPSKARGAAAGSAATAAHIDPTVFAIIGLSFVVLLIPIVVYTIWMNIRYSLAVPACVVENLKAMKAIKRSAQLSKGARWRILALLLMVFIIKIGLVGITQSFLLVMAFKHKGQISTGTSAVSQVIQFFTDSFLGPIGATGLTLFYFDQRVRKEGYDIEWMMQAAGLAQVAGLAQAAELPTDMPAAPDSSEAPLIEAAASEAPAEALEAAVAEVSTGSQPGIVHE